MILVRNPRTVALLLGAFALIGLAGCASATRVASNGAVERAASAQVHVALTKQEIGADIHNSNVSAATGGGLIAAFIDLGIEHSRAKKAEVAIVPVRDALLGYDVGKTFSEALQAAAEGPAWLKAAKIEVRSAADLGDQKKVLAAATADVVMTLVTDYKMLPDFNGVRVSVQATLRPRSAELVATAKGNPDGVLFANRFVTTRNSRAPLMPATHAGYAAAWAADGGKTIRAALDEALAELARMIVWDLKQDGPAGQALYKAGADSYMFNVVDARGLPVRGFSVRVDSGRSWIRTPSGELHSVTQ